jgi:NAD(P)H-flavin reductase
VEFRELAIASSRQETHELAHLELAAPDDYLDAYTTPGQYIQIKIGDLKPGFFALASAPHERRIELLVKHDSPLAAAVVARNAGDSVSVSLPQGKGFPIKEALGNDVFIVGVGSGIAPLRGLVREMLIDAKAYGQMHFLYGARTRDSFPFAQEIESWAERGIDVARVCSQPATGTWDGHMGRIQDLVRARAKSIHAQSAVYVCGMKAMVEDVKAAFAEKGLAPGRVFQNF